MALTVEMIKKIAQLAHLNLSENDTELYTTQLTNILGLVEQMNNTDTATIEPLAHPLDLAQRLRSDKISEPDLRDKYQKIAPQVEAGLYLVPKVIETDEA